jgi:outer membrane murein-binding lipoprotein Lpp
LRSQEKYDEVRVVVDRCKAQADMIREKITAAKLAAQAAQKEADVARARATLERSKKALEDAKVQKIRLGGKA